MSEDISSGYNLNIYDEKRTYSKTRKTQTEKRMKKEHRKIDPWNQRDI